jgi:hypothetical protein
MARFLARAAFATEAPALGYTRRMRSSILLTVAAAMLSACRPDPTWTTPVTGLAPILLSAWGSAPDDVWAVGGTCDPSNCTKTSQSLILHYDGSAWTQRAVVPQVVLWWVYGFAKDDVWIAGEEGTVIHYDGNTFNIVNDTHALAPDVKLFGIWGSSPTDLWAVGGKPDQSSTVLRYDGKAWREDMDAPPVQNPRIGGTWYKVWGSSAKDVWLVGQLGFLVHYDGNAYAKVDVSGAGVASQGLFTVAGRAPDDVWVVGGDPTRGIALHYDGKSWAAPAGLDLSNAPLLTGVNELPTGDVAITGLGGAKYVGRAGAFRDDTEIAPLVDLHAVWMFAPDDVYAVGGDFFALRKGVVAHYGQPVSSTLK